MFNRTRILRSLCVVMAIVALSLSAKASPQDHPPSSKVERCYNQLEYLAESVDEAIAIWRICNEAFGDGPVPVKASVTMEYSFDLTVWDAIYDLGTPDPPR